MTTTTPPTTAAPELVLVPPSTLFVDGNIRKAATLDPVLVHSIRDHGVLTPIVAVRNADGGLLVRLGQRRTLAAIEAGDQPVPVFVAGADDSDETRRIVEQWAENEHRVPLTTADRMAAIQQLSLLGVPADQIVHRTKATRVDVDHALAAAASKAARAAAEKHTELTLDHAATVAEFEDLPDVAAELVAVAVNEPARFAYAAQHARDNRARLEKIAAETARLEAAGIRVIDPDSVMRWDDRSHQTRRLDNLVDPGGKKLNGTTHKKCPGHGAVVDRDGDVSYVCTDWKGNGHVGRYDTTRSQSSQTPGTTSDAELEKAKAERRAVIDNNKAWPTAEKVRRSWLREFLSSKTAPKGAAGFLAVELVHGDLFAGSYDTRYSGKELAADLLGHANVTELAAAAAKATDGRATVIALAMALTRYEVNTDREHWRRIRPTTKRYLEFLEANGYPLADVEKLAAGRKLGRRPTKAAK